MCRAKQQYHFENNLAAVPSIRQQYHLDNNLAAVVPPSTRPLVACLLVKHCPNSLLTTLLRRPRVDWSCSGCVLKSCGQQLASPNKILAQRVSDPVTGHSALCPSRFDGPLLESTNPTPNLPPAPPASRTVKMCTSEGDIISLSPHLHTPFPPAFSPSLISRTVSVDVKHHVHLLTVITNSRTLSPTPSEGGVPSADCT